MDSGVPTSTGPFGGALRIFSMTLVFEFLTVPAFTAWLAFPPGKWLSYRIASDQTAALTNANRIA